MPQGEIEVEWFYHTSRVRGEMLNDDLRFKKDEGWDFKEVAEDSKKNPDDSFPGSI